MENKTLGTTMAISNARESAKMEIIK